MRWEHPNLSAADADADWSDCRRSAQYEAREQEWRDRFYNPPRYVRGRDGRLYRTEEPFSMFGRNDIFFREQQLTDFCMRSKGYRMVPVPQ